MSEPTAVAADSTPDALAEGVASLKVEEAAPKTDAAPAEASAPQPNGAAAPATESASPAAAAPASLNRASANQPTASLYVGELDPSVTEAMLYEIFSMIGPVASIRVCRDAVTRRSLGYAYVNFVNTPDGERALDTLNYSLIKGKACRIMWSQRDPALRKTGSGNVFLKNLDETIDNKALHDTFAAFGNILSCKVVLDEQGNSKGFGFVHFDTNEAADAAIAAVNGMLLNDKVVYVGRHVPKRERQAKIEEVRANFTNLYVKGLPVDATDAELNEKFAKFGTITSAVTVRDDGGKCKGFGFVNMESHEAAEAALNALNETEWGGNQLIVTRAQKKAEREDELRKAYAAQKYEKDQKFAGVNLYVKNLDDDMEESKLEAEFAAFGSITSCKIMRDEKDSSKGFAFVCFSSPEEATKAVAEMNGKMVGSKPLYVALAQRKDVRRQQLEGQMAQRNQMRNAQMGASGIPPMAGGPGMMPGMPNPYMQMPYGYYGQPQAFAQQGQRGMYGQPQMMQGQRGGPQQRYAPPGQMPMQQGGYPYPGGYPQQQPGRGPMGPGGPQGAGRMGPQQNGSMPQRPNGMPPQQQQQRGPMPEQGLTATSLANASPADRKQLLGEALYPRIHATDPDMAGKITGMLLEMDNSELLHLLEDETALLSKVQEAKDVLDAYTKTQA